MSNKKKIIIITSVLVLAILSVVGINEINDEKSKPKSTYDSGPHAYSSTWPKANDAERLKILEKDNEKLTDIAGAATKVKYKIKQPQNTLGKKLTGVFFNKDENGIDKDLTLYYEDGFFIVMMPLGVPVDYEAMVKQEIDSKKNGMKRSDTDFKLITVKGKKGISSEPGNNVWVNDKEPTPGVVAWYENGVQYVVYGYNNSVKELMDVANSMVDIN